MKNIYLILVVISAVLLISCAGEDKLKVDKIPPVSPILIPHLGDTGDLPVIYENQTISLNDENNGIDTVPDGDWIRILWQPFLDTDLSHVKVYRFNEFQTTPVLVDSIPSSNRYYLDSSAALNYETVYSYFIDLVDSSGNTARSDTVAYAILSKPQLISPDQNASVTPADIAFRWARSGFASKYRAVVFDANYEYVWHQDLVVSFEEDQMSILFPVNLAQQYAGQSLTWRIDSFEWNNTLQNYMGAESFERSMHIVQQRKTGKQ